MKSEETTYFPRPRCVAQYGSDENRKIAEWLNGATSSQKCKGNYDKSIDRIRFSS